MSHQVAAPLTEEYTPRGKVSHVLLVCSAIAFFLFFPLAVVVLLRGYGIGFAIALFGSGLQGAFLAAYALARAERKQRWRWIVMAAGK
jgi:cytochrome bd-type quinol oxidase subunit 2